MILSRAIIFPIVLGLSAPLLGCAAAKKSTDNPEVTSAEKLAELRAQRRRDRARLRQLEENMARMASERHASETLALPVERLEPETDDSAGLSPEEIVAIADDGTEIVYVGEAAQQSSVKADTRLLREAERARAVENQSAARRPTRVMPPPVVRPGEIGPGDSLGVTNRRLPKVAEVTKRAPPPPRARETTIQSRPRPRARRPGSASASAVAEYQRHVRALKAGKHEEAIRGLRRFVRRYARSDYADNAQYWLGEAYYDRKMFDEALAEFEKVAAEYPSGNKVPDAILKSAYCKINLGDKPGARAILTRITTEFPDSRIAQLAAEKLERLGK